MRKFSEADGGTPTGEAKDRVGLVAGTTYYAKYWNDNFFNIFNFVENAGYSLIDDDLEQLTKALKGRYVASYTYNTSAIATQTVNDVVQGSDGLYYEVQSDAVSGDDPVGSVTGNWLEVALDSENAKQWDKQTTTHNFTTDANYTLTAAQNKFGRIVLTDTNPFLTAARNVIVSDKIRDMIVYNATLQTLTIKTLAGSGIEVAAGAKVWLYCDGTNVIESIDGGGIVLDTAHFQTGTVATGTTLIPVDDTIPQQTEGTEFMTLSYTPKSATSKLRIEVTGNFAYSVNAAIIMALFRDSTAGSIGVVNYTIPSANNRVPLPMTVEVPSTATVLTTFKIRAGGNTAGTITFNGAGGAQSFNGLMASNITITEIEV